ncbi:hypothetical protein DL89DRAFT_268644 [Linderina pennispora]|uniref:Low temperature requirement protein A n=1 Tax=Linderina pennispora TaxID=61395 RepID=A0A1Y1W3K1_9FUNG|nr:uncharacterized protein DL89DRAFT_268644 [Linderina pennispora]ORX68111.1 hypothetical protein DL89DRAFT_268644 [Linderina pennispora]
MHSNNTSASKPPRTSPERFGHPTVAIDDMQPNRPHRSTTWVGHVDKWERKAQSKQQVGGEPIFQLPYPRQFIVDGTLRQSSFSSHSESLNLFWDLAFVGAIQQTSHVLFEEADDFDEPDPENKYALRITGSSLGYFVIIYFVMWKTWILIERWSQVFGANDILHRLIIVWEMVLVVGMGSELHVLYYFDDNVFVGCFCLARLTIVLLYAASMFYLPMFRGDLLLTIVFQTIPIIIWFASVWAPLEFQWYFYLASSLFELAFSIGVPLIIPIAKRLHIEWRYHLAMDVNRTAKRFGEFIMLTLGEYVLNSFIRGDGGLDSRLGRAALGMIIVSCLHWTYFHSEGSRLSQHALVRSQFTSSVWSLLHPFLGGLLVTGCSSLSRLVKEDEEGEDPTSVAWAFCGGIGGAYITLALLGFTHRSLDEIHYTYVSKPLRLVVRALAGAGIVLLGLAHKHLAKRIYLPLIVAIVTFLLMLFEMCGRLKRHVDDVEDSCDPVLEETENITRSHTHKSRVYDAADNDSDNEKNVRSHPADPTADKLSAGGDTSTDISLHPGSLRQRPTLQLSPGDGVQVEIAEETPTPTPAATGSTTALRPGVATPAAARWQRAMLVTQIGIRASRRYDREYKVSDVPGAASYL